MDNSTRYYKTADDLYRALADKNLTHKYNSIVRKAQVGIPWHLTLPMLQSYHARHSLSKHLKGRKETAYGFELEVEISSDTAADMQEELADGEDLQHYLARHIHRIARATIGAGLIRTETDGSLQHGIEIISCPLSAKEWRMMYSKLHRFFVALIRFGFISHNSGRCGLHFHVTRPAAKELINKIERLLLNSPSVKDFWKDFSRREAMHYCELRKQDERGANRYVAFNKLPSSTIEFRLFRGTLITESFIASLEAVMSLTEFVLTQTAIKQKSWRQYVKYARASRHCKIMRSYVANRLHDDWRLPPSTKELSPEERQRRKEEKQAMKAALEAERSRKAEHRFNERQWNLRQWLQDMERVGRGVYAPSDSNSPLRTLPIELDYSFSRRERNYAELVTPIVFRSIAVASEHPAIRLRRSRGWGRSRTYGAVTNLSVMSLN